jgi:WD40 repeat protein
LNLDLQCEVKAHQYSVYHLAINNDATLLYSCSNDGTICSWKLPGLEAGQTFTAHTESVRKLRFTSDGNLFSADEAGIVCGILT